MEFLNLPKTNGSESATSAGSNAALVARPSSSRIDLLQAAVDAMPDMTLQRDLKSIDSFAMSPLDLLSLTANFQSAVASAQVEKDVGMTQIFSLGLPVDQPRMTLDDLAVATMDEPFEFPKKKRRKSDVSEEDKKRRYKCSFPNCGKGFPSRAHALRHERIHTGEKPFQCPSCGKFFSRQDNMVQHYRSHSGSVKNGTGLSPLSPIASSPFESIPFVDSPRKN